MATVERLTFEEIERMLVQTQTTATILSRADEAVTRALKTINSDHAAIHEGYGFIAQMYLPSLAAGATHIYRYRGPTDLFAHVKSIQVGVLGATIIARIVRDVTITAAGDLLDNTRNANHNSTTAPESQIYNEPTYTGGETWNQVVVRGSTSGGIQVQSDSTFIQSDYLEYVTKDGNEEYIIEIENIDTETAEHISINMFFYEEELGSS